MIKNQIVFFLAFVVFFSSFALPEVAEAKRDRRAPHSRVKKQSQSRKMSKNAHKKTLAKRSKKNPGRKIASVSSKKSLKKKMKSRRGKRFSRR